MAPTQPSAKLEREKKLNSVLNFGSVLVKRLERDWGTSLVNDLQTQIRGLPLLASSAVGARQDELDRLGTQLWNLSTRLQRDGPAVIGKLKDQNSTKDHVLCLLRTFSFLLLDTASTPAKRRPQKSCIRLMKVALKAARVCIAFKELSNATKILERAAEYQDVLSKNAEGATCDDSAGAKDLRMQYFAVRTTLAWRQERMDTAEHMFAKCKQLSDTPSPDTTGTLADLLYEIGKDSLNKQNYEAASTWLERAYDTLGEQEMELLSPEACELRLSTMHGIVQAQMNMKTVKAREKAWDMMKFMEMDYANKLAVSLLKIELLSTADNFDISAFYNVLLRMIRTVVLNDTNFKTIMHQVHVLKEHSNEFAGKILDDLIDIRLFREENQSWIERAVITRIWVSTTNAADIVIEQLRDSFDTVLSNARASLSAPATHAAQTLLWKRVESSSNQAQFDIAEAWCRLCLHSIFDKAGAQNKARVARKIIQCALIRHDHAAAREAYNNMSESGRDEPVTRYLMYKSGIRGGDAELAAGCLEHICRNSTKDATLLYACVMEAQSTGDKKQAIHALQRVLDKYEYSAPAGIHLPALLRSTARLLQSELTKDGAVQFDTMNELCKLFEGAIEQAKTSRRRPNNVAQQTFTPQEFEWFSKNAYNLSLKYCAEMSPSHLVRLLGVCTEFIKLLKDQDSTNNGGCLSLRLVFCEFLAACTYVILARAEDNAEISLQNYLEARKHCQEFRRAASEGIDKLEGSAQADIISKHFQIVKLELEAVIKLEKWDELDDLFEQCWKYKSPDRYETLADLVLVIHSCIVQANVEEKYRKKVLSVLDKIISLTARQPGTDIVKIARWLRCLFNLTLPYDESISYKCTEQAINLATKYNGLFIAQASPAEVNHYPPTELEWLSTTAFNHAVDYYLQENDALCKKWAEQAFMLAQWLEDNGTLRDLLMEKYATLKLQS
ncbi:meiosis protein SPO22/ZIP4 like-domain-containing protein [Phaeosphaeria sp. MPI-PUGE-AT-0046c]|nr:meiosis protein SPO22/ZIP4 like-domain-containing protein [Phaeosphaeria sp. MPI-PUGE-AT-0046c]